MTSTENSLVLASLLDETSILNPVLPTDQSDSIRHFVYKFVHNLLHQAAPGQNISVFTFGSYPLKMYLPDGDIDIGVILGAPPTSNTTAPSNNSSHAQNQVTKNPVAPEAQTVISNIVNNSTNQHGHYMSALTRHVDEYCRRVQKLLRDYNTTNRNKNTGFHVNDVQLVHAEVRVVKCVINDIPIDISVNTLSGLSAVSFFEYMDNEIIRNNHLFKRTILLAKLWLQQEVALLAASTGFLSSYSVEILTIFTIMYYFIDLSPYFKKTSGQSLQEDIIPLPNTIPQMYRFKLPHKLPQQHVDITIGKTSYLPSPSSQQDLTLHTSTEASISTIIPATPRKNPILSQISNTEKLSLLTPMLILYRLLHIMSHWDWSKYAMSLAGPLPHTSLWLLAHSNTPQHLFKLYPNIINDYTAYTLGTCNALYRKIFEGKVNATFKQRLQQSVESLSLAHNTAFPQSSSDLHEDTPSSIPNFLINETSYKIYLYYFLHKVDWCKVDLLPHTAPSSAPASVLTSPFSTSTLSTPPSNPSFSNPLPEDDMLVDDIPNSHHILHHSNLLIDFNSLQKAIIFHTSIPLPTSSHIFVPPPQRQSEDEGAEYLQYPYTPIPFPTTQPCPSHIHQQLLHQRQDQHLHQQISNKHGPTSSEDDIEAGTLPQPTPNKYNILFPELGTTKSSKKNKKGVDTAVKPLTTSPIPSISVINHVSTTPSPQQEQHPSLLTLSQSQQTPLTTLATNSYLTNSPSPIPVTTLCFPYPKGRATFFTQRPIIVIDPLDATNNVTKSVSSVTFPRLSENMRVGFDRFTEYFDLAQKCANTWLLIEEELLQLTKNAQFIAENENGGSSSINVILDNFVDYYGPQCYTHLISHVLKFSIDTFYRREMSCHDYEACRRAIISFTHAARDLELLTMGLHYFNKRAEVFIEQIKISPENHTTPISNLLKNQLIAPQVLTRAGLPPTTLSCQSESEDYYGPTIDSIEEVVIPSRYDDSGVTNLHWYSFFVHNSDTTIQRSLRKQQIIASSHSQSTDSPNPRLSALFGIFYTQFVTSRMYFFNSIFNVTTFVHASQSPTIGSLLQYCPEVYHKFLLECISRFFSEAPFNPTTPQTSNKRSDLGNPLAQENYAASPLDALRAQDPVLHTKAVKTARDSVGLLTPVEVHVSLIPPPHPAFPCTEHVGPSHGDHLFNHSERLKKELKLAFNHHYGPVPTPIFSRDHHRFLLVPIPGPYFSAYNDLYPPHNTHTPPQTDAWIMPSGPSFTPNGQLMQDTSPANHSLVVNSMTNDVIKGYPFRIPFNFKQLRANKSDIIDSGHFRHFANPSVFSEDSISVDSSDEPFANDPEDYNFLEIIPPDEYHAAYFNYALRGEKFRKIHDILITSVLCDEKALQQVLNQSSVSTDSQYEEKEIQPLQQQSLHPLTHMSINALANIITTNTAPADPIHSTSLDIHLQQPPLSSIPIIYESSDILQHASYQRLLFTNRYYDPFELISLYKNTPENVCQTVCRKCGLFENIHPLPEQLYESTNSTTNNLFLSTQNPECNTANLLQYFNTSLINTQNHKLPPIPLPLLVNPTIQQQQMQQMGLEQQSLEPTTPPSNSPTDNNLPVGFIIPQPISLISQVPWQFRLLLSTIITEGYPKCITTPTNAPNNNQNSNSTNTNNNNNLATTLTVGMPTIYNEKTLEINLIDPLVTCTLPSQWIQTFLTQIDKSLGNNSNSNNQNHSNACNNTNQPSQPQQQQPGQLQQNNDNLSQNNSSPAPTTKKKKNKQSNSEDPPPGFIPAPPPGIIQALALNTAQQFRPTPPAFDVATHTQQHQHQHHPRNLPQPPPIQHQNNSNIDLHHPLPPPPSNSPETNPNGPHLSMPLSTQSLEYQHLHNHIQALNYQSNDNNNPHHIQKAPVHSTPLPANTTARSNSSNQNMNKQLPRSNPFDNSGGVLGAPPQPLLNPVWATRKPGLVKADPTPLPSEDLPKQKPKQSNGRQQGINPPPALIPLGPPPIATQTKKQKAKNANNNQSIGSNIHGVNNNQNNSSQPQ